MTSIENEITHLREENTKLREAHKLLRSAWVHLDRYCPNDEITDEIFDYFSGNKAMIAAAEKE